MWNNRERGGALALGGHHLLNYTQQSSISWHRQWKGSYGGRATRAKRVGGRCVLDKVIKIRDKKRGRDGALAVGGQGLLNYTRQSNKSRRQLWEGR